MVRALFILLCGWLLPLLAFADGVSAVTLQLVEATYRPGDVIELQAEMRRAEYAEFELHVPAHPQLHFVAHTREPVHYIGGEYVQRVLLLLQPMAAGEFELAGITASLVEGEQTTELALPPLQLTVESYAMVDESQALAEFGAGSGVLPKQVSLLSVTLCAVLVIYVLFWFLIRRSNTKPVEIVETELGLNDLIAVLEGDAPVVDLIEQLLERTDLVLSPAVREALEAAAYANRLDKAVLLRLLKEEGAR